MINRFNLLTIKITILILVASICSLNPQAQNKATRQKGSHTHVVSLPTDTTLYNRAVNGDADSQAFVGLLYYIGEGGVIENDNEALKWFKRSFNGQSPYGKYWLGIAYSNGIGSQDRTSGSKMMYEALEEIKERALNDDCMAQYHMGIAYRDGNTIEDEDEDYESAYVWFNKASNGGHLDAMCEAAECLKLLYGSKNKKAFDFLRLAAEQKYPRAQYEFSNYYFLGLGVQQSYEEELKLLMAAAEGGYNKAYYSVAQHYELGFGTERDWDRAIHWYEMANANYKLGCLYRDGVGVERNFDKAINYFSAATDDPRSKVAISEMRRKGRTYYSKLIKRNPDDFYDLKIDDPFYSMRLSDNWDDLNDYTKTIYLREFKEEKFQEWGEPIATKVANHSVELGFNREQISYSQGTNYKINIIYTPEGDIVIMSYPHCAYFLLNDKLVATLWDNGAQVGNTRIIKTYSDDIVILNN